VMGSVGDHGWSAYTETSLGSIRRWHDRNFDEPVAAITDDLDPKRV
jgi:hypothetical protein